MLELFKHALATGGKATFGRNENVEVRIREWLMEEGFEVEGTHDDRANFRYNAGKGKLPKISVAQPRGKSDSFLVESGINFRGAEEGLLRRMFDSKQNLLIEIRLQLVSKGLLHRIQSPDPQSGSPGWIGFAKPIYYDGLSKDRFMETGSQIINTAILIIMSAQRHSNVNEPSKEHSNVPYLV